MTWILDNALWILIGLLILWLLLKMFEKNDDSGDGGVAA